MKKFILLRGHSGEDLDATPCFLLEVGEELRERALDRAADAKELSEKHGTSFNSLEFFDYAGDWFDLYSLDDEREDVEDIQDRLGTEDLLELTEGSDLLKHIQKKVERSQYDDGASIRTDCNVMIVASDRIYFKMYPKHTDLQVESTGIEYSYLRDKEQG